MKWETVCSWTGPQARKALSRGDVLNNVLALGENRCRVALEQATDECCEKWRAICGGNDNRRDTSSWIKRWTNSGEIVLEGPVVFCPECGERL